jgi:hypothetical protein
MPRDSVLCAQRLVETLPHVKRLTGVTMLTYYYCLQVSGSARHKEGLG